MIIYKCENCGARWRIGINESTHAAACTVPQLAGVSEESLQGTEDMLDGKLLLNDDEVYHYLREDAKKLIAEVRRLQSLSRMQLPKSLA